MRSLAVCAARDDGLRLVKTNPRGAVLTSIAESLEGNLRPDNEARRNDIVVADAD